MGEHIKRGWVHVEEDEVVYGDVFAYDAGDGWILWRDGKVAATVRDESAAWTVMVYDPPTAEQSGLAVETAILHEPEGYDPDLDVPGPAMTRAEDMLAKIDPPSRARLDAIACEFDIEGLSQGRTLSFFPDGDVWWLTLGGDDDDAVAFAPTKGTVLRGCYNIREAVLVKGLPDGAAGHEAALAAIEAHLGLVRGV